jgi:hypothetical protein
MEIGQSQGFFAPVYFDLEPDEIIALTKSYDSLRIGIHHDKGEYDKVFHLVVASSRGACHSTLSKALGRLNPQIKDGEKDGEKYQGLAGGCCILYEEDRRLWFNMCDFSESEKLPAREGLGYFGEPARSLIKQILQHSIEQQNLLE